MTPNVDVTTSGAGADVDTQLATKFHYWLSVPVSASMPALANIGTIGFRITGKKKREAGPEFDTELDTIIQ